MFLAILLCLALGVLIIIDVFISLLKLLKWVLEGCPKRSKKDVITSPSPLPTQDSKPTDKDNEYSELQDGEQDGESSAVMDAEDEEEE